MPKDWHCSEHDFKGLDDSREKGAIAIEALRASCAAPAPAEAPGLGRYYTGKKTDPATWPKDLVLPVRAFPVTEITLQHLCAFGGLTFWGEAVHQVLAFCALNPDHVTIAGLRHVPPALFEAGRRRGKSAPAAPSRGIITPLSVEVDAWVQVVAAANRISRAKAASAILHKNARTAAAAIMQGRA